MEEELRISEQAERQKQVAAIAAAAPTSPAIDLPPEPEQPHVPPPAPSFTSSEAGSDYPPQYPEESAVSSESDPVAAPAPIATSGELSILPPSTGLPVASSASSVSTSSSNGAAPMPPPTHETELETETLHG
jgi:sec-independent protein translocase protein TatB